MFTNPDSEYQAWRAERRLVEQRAARRGGAAGGDRAPRPAAAPTRVRRRALLGARRPAAPLATLRRIVAAALGAGGRAPGRQPAEVAVAQSRRTDA